jgi:hypothetical protein
VEIRFFLEKNIHVRLPANTMRVGAGFEDATESQFDLNFLLLHDVCDKSSSNGGSCMQRTDAIVNN